ncbi:MAG: DNA mismatch repair protein MutS, partial [Myxococcota bacterium]|nr:DNA mismatch repair protein MutS [Myxococcota bacterium]
MFRQYLELKSAHTDALLFFRMGDFYELFFEDAQVAAEALDLTLTSRNKGKPDAVPMCGVPHHAAGGYIQSLIDAGHKVAIGEQVEDARKAKGLVKREVTRVISPGVRLDPESLAPRENCWLVGLAGAADKWGVAFLDVSTGELRLTELEERDAAIEEMQRAGAAEAILPRSLEDEPIWMDALSGLATTWVDDGSFDVELGRQACCRAFGVVDLSGLGCEDQSVSLGVVHALLEYARSNAGTELPHLQVPRTYRVSGHVVLDETTRRNLELVRPLRGAGRKGTLLGLMDKTRTPMGGRLLRDWLLYPLVERARIQRRLDSVETLVDTTGLREAVRSGLREVSDVERIAGKLAQQTASARDLVALRLSLESLPGLVEPLRSHASLKDALPEDLCEDVASEIGRWLVDEPPIQLMEGGLIRPGIDPDLDELMRLCREGKGAIAAIEDRERDATQIPSLKVRYNKVFGYFIEVTRANLHKVPDSYMRKQTLTNAERFVTPELKEFEEKVLGADERRKSLEYHHFTELRAALVGHLPRLQELARSIARLDVLGSLAQLAVEYRYVRPELDLTQELDIVGGRHPVVERQVIDEDFVPNDLVLGGKDGRLVILTGPNMSGKSTVMRQVALIALMAQMGSFVPAKTARIGLCDRIFTRVGASDDLSSGRSTFMVEMSETANILRHATDRSLVLLDEIGRGTSTYDGLAIAWSVAESICDDIRARAIFATHYHELVELSLQRD